MRFYVVSLLIITTYTCFNAIPDFAVHFYGESIDFLVVSFLWTVGYLADPIIYIFLNKKVKFAILVFANSLSIYTLFL